MKPTFRTIAKGEATPTDNSAVKTAADVAKPGWCAGCKFQSEHHRTSHH